MRDEQPGTPAARCDPGGDGAGRPSRRSSRIGQALVALAEAAPEAALRVGVALDHLIETVQDGLQHGVAGRQAVGLRTPADALAGGREHEIERHPHVAVAAEQVPAAAPTRTCASGR